MDKDFAMRWVAKLRDPKVRQIKDRLYDGRGYCCLGVAERVAGSRFVSDSNTTTRRLQHSCNRAELSEETCQKYDIYTPVGSRRDNATIEIPGQDFHFTSLQVANDSGVKFAEIADYIEANYEAL